jgi:hypothetical protein
MYAKRNNKYGPTGWVLLAIALPFIAVLILMVVEKMK